MDECKKYNEVGVLESESKPIWIDLACDGVNYTFVGACFVAKVKHLWRESAQLTSHQMHGCLKSLRVSYSIQMWVVQNSLIARIKRLIRKSLAFVFPCACFASFSVLFMVFRFAGLFVNNKRVRSCWRSRQAGVRVRKLLRSVELALRLSERVCVCVPLI